MPAPVTPVLDDFNRANESPLTGGGNWTGPIFDNTAADQLALVSNQVVAATATNSCSSYWTPTTFNADQEVYATITGLPLSANRDMAVHARITDPGTGDTWDGYQWSIGPSTWSLNSFTDNVRTVLASGTYPSGGLLPLIHVDNLRLAVAIGMTMWLRCIGTTIEGYIGFGPEVLLWASVTDSSHNNAGLIGINCHRSGPAFDDFGGGNL